MQIVNTETGLIRPATPNQVNAYWATARQNLALLYRSDTPESTIDAVRSQYADILESTILTYPPLLEDLGLRPSIFGDVSFKDKKEILGIEKEDQELTEDQKKLLKRLEQTQEQSRKQNWRWRIAQEVEEKQLLGWYPFFVTLTVDPSHPWFNEDHKNHQKGVTDPKTLWTNGRPFRKFIRRLCNVVTKKVGHPPAHKKCLYKGKKYDYRPESDYITYVGIIEHGKSREHHHAHFLIFMKDCPDHWKRCPNRYIRNPRKRINRECIPARRYWPWSLPGKSKFNYFRTKGDVWHTEGHAIPIDEKKGKPIAIGDARLAGIYVTKYIQKGYKEWKHRVKATRNLGLKKLKQEIQKLDQKIVEQLSWRPINASQHHSVSLIHSVPLGLIRSLAKQINYSKLLEKNLLDFQTVMINNSGSYTKMLRSAQSGHKVHRMPSQDFYDWVCQHLPVQKGYCSKLQLEAHENLRKVFPRLDRLVNIQTQAGNIYEST
jgi:hypothetical protein